MLFRSEEVKKQIQSARSFDMKSEISNTIDPKGEINQAMDLSKEAADFNKSMKSEPSQPAAPAPAPAVAASDDADKKTDKS